MLLHVILVLAMTLCAIYAIRSDQLLSSVLWLAGLSVLVSIQLYILGATEIAVIEMSVGAGLVTVLFVFAIGIAGEVTRDLSTLVPRWLAWAMSGAVIVLLGWSAWSAAEGAGTTAQGGALSPSFSAMLWEARAVDMIVAIVLIFAGVLAMLNLLRPVKKPAMGADPPAVDIHNPASTLAMSQSGGHGNGHSQQSQSPRVEVQP